jgi:hypothetical protein
MSARMVQDPAPERWPDSRAPASLLVDPRRRAELDLELRLAALAIRFPAWSGTAADAIRSPIDFRRLVSEIGAQSSRRWTAVAEMDLLRSCVRRLHLLRGEVAAP